MSALDPIWAGHRSPKVSGPADGGETTDGDPSTRQESHRRRGGPAHTPRNFRSGGDACPAREPLRPGKASTYSAAPGRPAGGRFRPAVGSFRAGGGNSRIDRTVLSRRKGEPAKDRIRPRRGGAVVIPEPARRARIAAPAA
ncbi:hypothetical protein GCM10020358_19330 [Amorphoplanes nipponensis]|uniref:Uncharacterized protein n=1 Tax=Actinoplanes nipponensis TaxID=135950 RepID=A0A919ML96_9ACTN|nr:hypothetical protein Ani05nite_28300 [Actinoplanes nipponensis]